MQVHPWMLIARPFRIEYPGAFYHITSRGNAKMPIFDDDKDSECFIGILENVVKRFNWVVYAYCLFGTMSLCGI